MDSHLHVGVAASASAAGFTQSTQSYTSTVYMSIKMCLHYRAQLLSEAYQTDITLQKSLQKLTEALNSLCQLTEDDPSILPMPSIDASSEMVPLVEL